MSPALNGSSAIRHFKHGDASKIRDRITFDFYTGLPHIVVSKIFFWGGVLMREIKIPLQDFTLKMQGELMHKGSVFAGHYGTWTPVIIKHLYTKTNPHRYSVIPWEGRWSPTYSMTEKWSWYVKNPACIRGDYVTLESTGPRQCNGASLVFMCSRNTIVLSMAFSKPILLHLKRRPQRTFLKNKKNVRGWHTKSM